MTHFSRGPRERVQKVDVIVSGEILTRNSQQSNVEMEINNMYTSHLYGDIFSR